MASYHFLSGFTSKVAGTEVGVDEPRPTFSACFGAPFMPLHASRYATMLAERLSWHETDCWLVNTGWTGGPYGVGERMSIELTRALLAAALDGSLAESGFTPHPVFKVLVPHECARCRRGRARPARHLGRRGRVRRVRARSSPACSARTSSSTPSTSRPRCWRPGPDPDAA